MKLREKKARLSAPGKMPCLAWGLPAKKTCPGAILDGKVTERCSTCYALQGHTMMPASQEFLLLNMHDWQAEDWEDRMIEAIRHALYHRWFHSGDGYKKALWIKIINIIRRTPDTLHWIPTSVYETGLFRDQLKTLKKLPNVSLRYSAPNYNTFESHHGSVIYTTAEPPKNTIPCRAYTNDGKCGDCRRCWDKEGVIAYPHHGTAKKILKIWRKAS